MLSILSRIGSFGITIAFLGIFTARAEEVTDPPAQYKSADIIIPAASESEPKLAEFSAQAADRYLRDGALAWSREKRCVSCHTNGSYLAVRASLTSKLGPPPAEIRDIFIDESRKLAAKDVGTIRSGAKGATIAYVALGLAEWDTHVAKALSAETESALAILLTAQNENGGWANEDCWPPMESDMYHATTVAAMALATAPGWLDNLQDEGTLQQIDRMKQYLRRTDPPHDYGRVLLLWAATRMPSLLEEQRKRELVELIWSHQRSDGGWSLRTIAAPEQWGSGNRAEKIRAEPDFEDPPSDGHMTGLAVLVLRDAGIAVGDPRIKTAVRWLKTNQRASGRWWTRSLNTDTFHFITFSSTGYALTALARCDEL